MAVPDRSRPFPRCWRPRVESHGNRTNSTSKALKTAPDLAGAGVALGSEETLVRAVQLRKPKPARAAENCVAVGTGYGTRSTESRRVLGDSRLRPA